MDLVLVGGLIEMDNWYKYELLEGNEPFTFNGEPFKGIKVLDLWRRQHSNILDDLGEFSEFIVGTVLGVDVPTNKLYWAEYDLDYRGYRLEIKATSYVHTWTNDIVEHRAFGIKPTLNNGIQERNNDIYVFCLFTPRNVREVNIYEFSLWEFYIVPTSYINEVCGDAATVSLSRIIGPDGIYDSRLSNGPIESLNRKAKDLKRSGRGYRNFAHLRNRFLFSTRFDPALNGKEDKPVIYVSDDDE